MIVGRGYGYSRSLSASGYGFAYAQASGAQEITDAGGIASEEVVGHPSVRPTALLPMPGGIWWPIEETLAHNIIGAGGIAGEEVVSRPRIRTVLKVKKALVVELTPQLFNRIIFPHNIVGAGWIESEARVGSPVVAAAPAKVAAVAPHLVAVPSIKVHSTKKLEDAPRPPVNVIAPAVIACAGIETLEVFGEPYVSLVADNDPSEEEFMFILELLTA